VDYDKAFYSLPTCLRCLRVTRMTNNVTMSKKYWSQQETEVLVNQFIHRKAILFSSSATKQAKRRAWKEIHEAILSECPLDKPKDMAELRKKWHNLLANTKKAMSLYNSSLKGN